MRNIHLMLYIHNYTHINLPIYTHSHIRCAPMFTRLDRYEEAPGPQAPRDDPDSGAALRSEL